ncbi:hypothetical protein [Opitutus sp. GAS368]|uniref:hypothetical protein n=1 Tax=Opitutus sp. GAS368 TaxID=1882749 RepID=UPI000879F627|nr:hypothetical protein [Opitutus sp. GAS368]SDS07531.1 hypothetical protein SAMN05444173_1811 [Opitutus sp. GAS368]
MFTILGADGKEYGPVATAKIHEWINGGRANLLTKARRDGESEWKTLGDFAEFAPAPGAATPPAAVVPTQAPGSAADSVATPPTGTIGEIAAAYSARARLIDPFDCLGRSFELWKSNFLPLVGVTLMIMLIQMVIGFIPLLGMFAGLFLNGVFYGGLYYYYLGKIRSEPREIGDAFAGFSRAFVPLMLASLLSAVLIITVLMPFFGPVFLVFVKAALAGGHARPDFTGLSFSFVFLGIIPLLYISIAWVFTFVLVIDKGLGPWTAMEVSRRVVTRQWFRVFITVFFGAILTLLGLIGLFIGVLVTLPLMIGATLFAYEDLFNPPPKG